MKDKEIISKLGGNSKMFKKINKAKNTEAGTKGVIYVRLGAINQWAYKRIPAQHRPTIAGLARREKPPVELPDDFLTFRGN